MWEADPENVKILDVRTPEEYLFVGHPPMAWKIPLAGQSYAVDRDDDRDNKRAAEENELCARCQVPKHASSCNIRLIIRRPQ